MPARYNSRASSMYRYNEPTISQYESFFNPIPLEFVQEQFDRRQGAYDEAYAGAMQAKDQFNNAKVGAPDIQYAKQLTNQFVEDTDKMVQEQFGGDWGKAAKTIARNVTNVRGNEFWQKAQTMDQLREEERKLVAQFGPDALKFKSLQDRSVVDPKTGKMITPEEMKYDVLKRGDWEGSVAKMFAGLRGDQKSILLKKYQNDPSIQNYLQYGTTEGISDEKLRMLASDKDIVNSFLSGNQDFRRAAEELPDYFGSMNIDPETGKKRSTEDIASDYIYGQIKPKQYSQTQISYTHDASAEARQKAAGEINANPYIPSSQYSGIVSANKDPLKEHNSHVDGLEYDKSGKVIKGVDVHGTKGLTTEELKQANEIADKYSKGISIANPSGGGNAGQTAALIAFDKEMRNKDRVQAANEYYNKIITDHPSLKGLSQQEAFKTYSDYLQRINSSSTLESNVKLADSPKNVTTAFLSNPNATNLQSLTIASSGDTFDKTSLVHQLGYSDYSEFAKEIKSQSLNPRVNFAQAKLAIDVVNKKKGADGKTETVLFDPDVQTKDVLNYGQMIQNSYYNDATLSNDYNENPVIPIPDGRGNYLSEGVRVVGTGDIKNGNKKIIEVYKLKYNPATGRMEPDANYPVKTQSLEKTFETLTEFIDVKYNNYEGKSGNQGKE